MKDFLKTSYGKIVLLVSILLVIDLGIKIAVNMVEPNVTIIPNGFRICFAENMGIAGRENTNQSATIFSSIIVLGIMIKFLVRQKDRMDTKTMVSISLILAGGISNFAERVIFGKVTDYLQIFPEKNFPIFNLADIYILVGWVLFAAILAYLTGRRPSREERLSDLKEFVEKETQCKSSESKKKKKSD